MGFLIFDLIFAGIGKLYFSVRYPEKEKRAKVLQNDYDDSYALVGKAKVAKVFGLLFLMLLLGFLIVVIWRTFLG